MILYRNLHGTPSKDPLKDPIQEFSIGLRLAEFKPELEPVLLLIRIPPNVQTKV